MRCPVCQSNSEIEEKDAGRYLRVNCPRCGSFDWQKDISLHLTEYKEHKTLLSYWIRNNQKEEERLYLNDQLISKIIQDVDLPPIGEKAQNLLYIIGSDLPRPDKQIILNEISQQKYIAQIGAIDSCELSYIIEYLKSKGWVNSNVNYKPGAENKIYRGYIALTFMGWSEFEAIHRGDDPSDIAFMAMDFNDDKVGIAYKKCFKPAVKKTGYKLYNLREKPEAGLIDNRLRLEIRKSKFLLADLTNNNLGAYWEAGFAEGLGKPVIYLCEKSHFDQFKTHFDTNHYYTVIYDHNKLDDAAEDIKITIRATLPAEAKMND